MGYFQVNKLRLTKRQQQAIIVTFQKCFMEGDHIWLFGSRIDPNRKGGDIDLYIETNEKNGRLVIERKISFLSNLKLIIGDQKIDVVINMGDKDLPIYKEARLTGIKLL